ncbi:MAG: 4-hydroxy-tetrahydrodipicolinate synthase [Acidobacteria bacterium RBG_16_64_8]|nr:MAG: 4-hydroxy-tetrahydrodipicolinate synthase [Acidobacteria bacterium RBG_16_64_8]
MASFIPKGLITALVTPFDEHGSINWSVLATLLEYQVTSGISGVVVTAGAGEYVNLSPEERNEVVRRSAEILQGRIRLAAGILAPDTHTAVTTALAARDAGAEAVLVLTPYYSHPSSAGLVSHFRRVAEEVRLPIILYNNPGRTGINLDVPVLEQLADIPDVVGVKECDRDLGRVAVKIARLGGRLAFMSGDDDLCLPIWSIGAVGAFMASTNLVAPWAVACFKAAQTGDWDGARTLFFSRLLPFITLYRGPDHPGPLKQALTLAGFPVGTARPPLQPLSPERLSEMARALRELALLDQVQV